MRTTHLSLTSVCIAATLLTSLIAVQPVAAGTGDTLSLTARLGSGSSASITSTSGTSGSLVLKLSGLKPKATYSVGVFAGPCSSSGTALLTLPSFKASASGKLSRTTPLNEGAVTRIVTAVVEGGGVTIRTATGTTRRCSAFSGTARRAARVTSTIMMAGIPDSIAVGGGTVWVADFVGQSVAKIDSTTGKVTGYIAVDADPNTVPYALAYGEGALWVASLMFGDDDQPRPGIVQRIDPASGQVVATIATGKTPYALAAGLGSVWVANYDDKSVTRIDPATNTASATITVGANPSSVAFGAGAVWVASQGEGTVARIDPASGTVSQTIPVGIVDAVAATDTDVWVSSPAAAGAPLGTLIRIDPSTNAITGSTSLSGSPRALAATKTDVWVVLNGQDKLARVDVASRRVETVGVQPHPWSLAVDGRTLWVTELGLFVGDSPAGLGSVECIAF